MKGNDILRAMDGIDEAIVAECMEAKRPRLRWLPALAACLAVIMLVGLLLPGSPIAILDPGKVQVPLIRWEGAVPQENGKASVVSPQAGFHLGPVVVARAVEVLADTYEDLPTYGVREIRRWRIFRMEIIDPLDSGLTDEFYFGLPEGYYQDLTAWDTLLLSLELRELDLTLRNVEGNSLQTFDYFYYDPIPYHGNTVAFTDGVFDESLWQHTLWMDPPYYPGSAYSDLDRIHNSLILQRGSTLDEVLANIEAKRAEDGYTPDNLIVPKAVRRAMNSLDSSFLGTGYDYVRENGKYVRYILYTRYIGGCATNEYALIHPETGEIRYSDAHFEKTDLKNLPDLAAFVQALDWDDLELPPFEKRGERLYRAIYGWYEQRSEGVLAFVKVTWYHASTEGGKMAVVYDDLFLQVTADGSEILTRQQIAELLGERNPNLPDFYDLGDKEGPVHLMWK